MNINITSITVLQDPNHTDQVLLHTTLPPAVWPWYDSPSLRIDIAREEGPQYCAQNFPGVPVEVIGRGGTMNKDDQHMEHLIQLLEPKDTK